jgi:Uma2 family endonuclease
MHLNEIQSVNRKPCRGAGPAPSIVFHPTNNPYSKFYPDIMVTCDKRDQETLGYKRFPCLIIEVLSDSTERLDRGDKFADYQTIETLQEYILINTKKPRVECFRRNQDGFWVLQSYVGEETSFQLQSINFQGTMTQLYEDVDFPPPG